MNDKKKLTGLWIEIKCKNEIELFTFMNAFYGRFEYLIMKKNTICIYISGE